MLDRGEEVTDILKTISTQIERISQQEKPYSDYSDALKDAERLMISCLDGKAKTSSPASHQEKIDIKIIAVAMTFTWGFIRDHMPRILREYPHSTANVELAFVEPGFLEALELEKFDIDYADESRKRIRDIPVFRTGLADPIGERLSISARLYKNIPHWHGFLINDEFLFLGRTDWCFARSRPRITVGQNKYRYFDRCSSVGIERIELFKAWHKYYSKHASELLSTTR